MIGFALAVGLGLAWWSEQALSHLYSAVREATKETQITQILISLWQQAIQSPWRLLFGVIGPVLGGYYVYWFRYALVEYVGDVAIYVSSFEVSAYEEIRNSIQKAILDVGKQIAAATDPPSKLTDLPGPDRKQLYDGMTFVGHSLGSVITYDLVNALIVWDATCNDNGYDVVKRIKRLITFGSPLDKTAFLFRTQTSNDHHYREAMAGQMQPLILDYDFRPYPWVNIFSRKDIVSGSLAYYDVPTNETTARGDRVPNYVINISDPEAGLPILAHTKYWSTKYSRRNCLHP